MILPDALVKWAGVVPELRESRRPLTETELRTLAQFDLIEIGAPSVSHPFLPVQPLAVQTEEIHESKVQLERLLDSPITSLAYPYGEYSRETLSLAKNVPRGRESIA